MAAKDDLEKRGSTPIQHETRSGQDLGDLTRGGGMDTARTPHGFDPLKKDAEPKIEQVPRDIDTTRK